ncbi:MAG: lysophospholipase [Ruminococcus sp.]|nr:lysophospholipase [Ruminococcus sp.]MCM1382087.1 lysophospholipase [Muribaculaceae bacterium]MCM1480856.1 lysophospholipase [Muribaculaceae bacterium]
MGKLKCTLGILFSLILAGCGISEPTSPDNSLIEKLQQNKNLGDETVMLSEFDDTPVYEYRQREITVKNNGQKIYGIAYIPDTDGEQVPLVICAHGLGGSYYSCLDYAEEFARRGLAAYCFDFRGGGGGKSDGRTEEMSVMTEVSDLEAILSDAANWEFVNADKITLFGESQGGIASAIAAARHTDEVAGLILAYPAFLVSDAVRELYNSPDEVPESIYFNWITVGRPYVVDMLDYDVYSEIGNYEKKVLLMHGDADGIVPISYSDRAAEVYSDVSYYVLKNAGHGFYGKAFDEAMTYILNYLREIEILK